MGGRFPVRPSISGVENVTDFKDESPSDNAPPIPKRSHARVPSGTLDLQLQKPGEAPLLQSNSEANRSRSDIVSSLSSIRDHDLSQISTPRRYGGQAVMIDTALSINPATSSFVDSGYGSKSSASSKQRVGTHEDDSDNRSIRTDGK
jgi:hypothetical protein